MSPTSASTRLAERLACRRVGDVGLKGPGLAAALADLGGGLLEARGVAAVMHDIGAGFRHGERHDAPEAAAAAGDEGVFCVEPEAIEHVQTGFVPRRSGHHIII